MSAPTYSSSNYDTAANKYEQLAKKYTGESAYRYSDVASKQANAQAKATAESEGAAAQNVAKNAGYSRARAALEGAAARAAAYKNQYANSYQNAYNNINGANAAALQAQGALLSGAAQKDANKYQSDSNRYGSAMGAVGGIFTGASNALSDVTKKDIHAQTDSERRRSELLARLKGGR